MAPGGPRISSAGAGRGIGRPGLTNFTDASANCSTTWLARATNLSVWTNYSGPCATPLRRSASEVPSDRIAERMLSSLQICRAANHAIVMITVQ